MNRIRQFVAFLTLAMVSAHLIQGVAAASSPLLVSEFGLSSFRLGLLFSAITLVSALSMPLIGVAVDRVGPIRVLGMLFIASAVCLVLFSVAQSYLVLVGAAAIGGVGTASANPATNKLISESLDHRQQMLAVTFKQTGAPAGMMLAGIALPFAQGAIGWRAGVISLAIIPVIGLSVLAFGYPNLTGSQWVRDSTPVRSWQRTHVRGLSAGGFFMAAGVSTVSAFLPVYAQEVAGWTVANAGRLIFILGIAGVIGRVGWGLHAGRLDRMGGLLVWLPVWSAMFVTILAIGPFLPNVVLVLGALGAGATMMGWHTLVWLVIVGRVRSSDVGRASAALNLTTLIGFGVGPPTFGTLTDWTQTYAWSWAVTIGFFVLAAVTTIRWRRHAKSFS